MNSSQASRTACLSASSSGPPRRLRLRRPRPCRRVRRHLPRRRHPAAAAAPGVFLEHPAHHHEIPRRPVMLLNAWILPNISKASAFLPACHRSNAAA